jgi:hypothetical protein
MTYFDHVSGMNANCRPGSTGLSQGSMKQHVSASARLWLPAVWGCRSEKLRLSLV